MSTKSAASIIKDLGFTGAKAFQGAWNLGPALVVDGIIGPDTTDAARKSWARHQAGDGDISEHFSAGEFACKCNGRYTSCRGVWVSRALVVSLEKLRGVGYQHGLTVVSGCRCQRYNAQVGGASGSQHLDGLAADIPGRLSLESLRSRRLFTGLGYRASDRLVVHVDRRPGRSVSNPATWSYS